MRPSTIWYILKQGFKNIKRNWMFSMASILTMSACIFLFGIFYSIVYNIDYIAHRVETEFPITVFFTEGISDEEIQAVGEQIQTRPEVDHIEFESADEAWESFKEQYFQGSDAADGFKDDNPLVNSANYRVYLNEIEKQSELVGYIESLEGVREVNRSEEAANTLGSINKLVSYVSIAVIVLLLIISVFLISNTISVGISVRKEEIGIMKYIGATDRFVRSPFVLEGILIGMIGAAIPLAALYFAYNSAVQYILTKFNVLAIGGVQFIPVYEMYETLLPVGLLLGMGIGLVGSFWTTRKHLKV
ncbi:MAG: permease-like cell division protein FtsX [Blautia sp.]|nr:permease-like cell division protein FtsX [Blautia sp.]MDY5030523.1 permease-like cell division protein FtsX [Blautia sp.]